MRERSNRASYDARKDSTRGLGSVFPICNWDADPKNAGSNQIPLTDRDYINVYSLDGKILSSFWKCTYREVYALVCNKVRETGVPVRIKDSEGREECVL